MHVLEPLQTVVTVDGELRRGKVLADDQALRVECAVDGSWVYLYDDDREEYDLLSVCEDGALRSTQPSITTGWTEKHFAWIQDYLVQPEPPEPVDFVRRPPQGFSAVPAPAMANPPAPKAKPKTRTYRNSDKTPAQMTLHAVCFSIFLIFGICMIPWAYDGFFSFMATGLLLTSGIGGLFHCASYFINRYHL